MTDPVLQYIGIVHSDISDLANAPKNYSESDRIGTLEIYPEFTDAMDGIEVGRSIVVLFWLHKASRDELKVYPRGDRSRGLRGVFSTRSPVRPNPIAISELKVLSIDANRVEVQGLDMLDQTPIVDIKKKID